MESHSSMAGESPLDVACSGICRSLWSLNSANLGRARPAVAIMPTYVTPKTAPDLIA